MTTTHVIPPIVKSVVVPGDPARAFTLFTDRVGEWWPLATHSVGGATSQVELTPAGFVERTADGGVATWGEILAWDPPRRVAFTWHPGYAAGEPSTEVTVTFEPADQGTAVRLEHAHWERLGARAADTRDDYDSGWGLVLDGFVTLAE